jgi:hypothetical protein
MVGAVVAAALALSGCVVLVNPASSGTSAEPAHGSKKMSKAARKAACATNRAMIDTAYNAALATSGHGSVSISYKGVLKDTGAVCPSGGTYSFSEKKNRTKCSVHGY